MSIATTAEHETRRQPRGLMTLSLLEVWERFSFYGMVAILVLFLIAPPDGESPPGPGPGFSEVDAAAAFGTYSALVFCTPLLGGWIGDRLVGPRRALVAGAWTIAIGHGVMLLPGQAWFWTGLLLIAMGTGLLKPNISAVLTRLYDEDDPRRDGGFSVFYMSINIGAFVAPIVCGWLATTVSWRLAFSVAGLGMLIGLGLYGLGRRTLGDAGRAVPRPATDHELRRALVVTVAAIAAGVGIMAVVSRQVGLTAAAVTAVTTIAIVALAVGYFWRLLAARDISPVEHSRLRAFGVLFLAAVAYFAITNQVGSTISEFAQAFSDRQVGDLTVPTSWLLSVNPVFVIGLAPLFAALWTRLGDRSPRTPVKFAIAVAGVGVAFMIMAIPGAAADAGRSSALWWVVGTILAMSACEMLLSPIGLSVTTQLAPPGLASQMLGLWFLGVALGNAIGGQAARLRESVGYGGYFAIMGLLAVAAGLVLLALSRRVSTAMSGVH